MAANSRKKGAKDSKHSLQEALDECHDLLQKMKKPKRKSHFNFFRDPLTRRRKIHYPYKPRFQDEHVPCTSSNDGKKCGYLSYKPLCLCRVRVVETIF